MIENGTLLQDRYLIEKQIGAGGMGAVYLAVDRRFDSYVAIKETFYNDAEFGPAFEREARLLNGLNHPSLPHVSDFFTENNIYFLVMQYIEGEDLSEILKREGAFSFEKVRVWTDRLLDALEFLHSQEPPIIHRDIKPQNLKLTPRGEIVLLDFGLAKLNSEENSSVKSVFGYSRKYSPLEQIQGTGTDARSDIFSLAATAYHLITGKTPIDVLARASEIVAGKADPLQLGNEINNKIPEDFANVLHTALALNANERFASAAAMRNALKNHQEMQAAPAIAPVIAPKESGILKKDEIFPALQSFAAANDAVAAPLNSENFVTKTEPVTGENELNSFEAGNDYRTNVVARKNSAFLPIAAIAAVFFAVIGTVGYFALRSNTVTEANQLPAQAEPAPTNPVVDNSTEILPDSGIQQAETNSNSNTELADKKEPVSEPSTKQKQTAKAGTSKPSQPQTPRKNQTAQTGETRERIVEDEPIIEEEPVISREERIRRRQDELMQKDELTEEEFQELRRERRRERRERRQRQNRNQPPPF